MTAIAADAQTIEPSGDRRAGVSAEYRGPERRQDYMQWRAHVNERLDAGAEKMDRLQVGLEENTRTTNAVQSNTQEAVDLLNSFKGAFVVLEKIGKLARPLGYITMLGAAIVSFWAALKGSK